MNVHVPDFQGCRILVAGDVMLDRYWQGATSRISPEAPVPVVRVEQTEERPGGAGNVAMNVAVLGGRTTLIGLTGDDEAAGSLRRLLAGAGVQCVFDSLPGASTIVKLRVLSRHQQLIRLDFEDGFGGRVPASLMRSFADQVPAADVVVLSDYGKGTLRPIEGFIERARKSGKRVIVDPKSKDFSIYRGASLITPNMQEFEAAAGHCATEDEILRRGRALLESLNLEALLITRSERGMTLLPRGQSPVHLPAVAKEVFDVTGAGDTVVAVLAAAWAAGCDLAEAASLANSAAGIVVSKLGTATVSVPELRRALHERSGSDRGVVTEETLLTLIEDARAHRERIVMTNGCFDIIHAGHVDYLEKAKRFGNRLIVAVNDDDSVRRLKGKERPVNPLEHRMAVLAALDAVDWVVPFSEDTPARIISRIRPDILVKGGDYKPDEVVGRESAGEVRILNLVEGCSTTQIVRKIRGAGE